MVQPAPAIATREICSNCGSHNIFPDDEGRPYCGSCGRRKLTYADYGRIGGLQTVLRHPPGYMRELGAKGGRPRLRQLPAPIVQSKRNGGNRLPNSLKGLKELYKLQNKSGGSLTES
jgi:ribosomal protein S27AE